MNMRLLMTTILLCCSMIGFTGFGIVHAVEKVIDFELEIELKDGTKYDFEYEVEHHGIEAKYKAPGENTVYGETAQAKIEPIITKLNLTPSMNKNVLRKDIIALLQIDPKNIDDFELEVKFDNKKKLKINK